MCECFSAKPSISLRESSVEPLSTTMMRSGPGASEESSVKVLRHFEMVLAELNDRMTAVVEHLDVEQLDVVSSLDVPVCSCLVCY